MIRKLLAKTQYLNPTIPDDVGSFSKGIVIEPESEDLILKKGTIYAVYEISSSTGFDHNLVTKVLNDVIHDAYYQSENISPVQSLEKAISDVRDRVTKLANESINPEDQAAVFSIIAGVLWGNVMYVVQYGHGQSYLVRSGEIRPINTVSEGTFSAASGIVKDEDVIIFCSKAFAQKYPPDKLLAMAIGEQELHPLEACILLKFTVDTSFSPSEVVDFGLGDAVTKKAGLKKAVTSGFNFIKVPEVIKTIFAKKSKAQGPQGIRPRPQVSTLASDIKLKSDKPSKFKLRPIFVILLILGALTLSIFLTLRNKKTTPPTQQVSLDMPQEDIKGTTEAPPAEEKDEEIFYDIKITEASATPDTLTVFKDKVVVTDSQSGKLYYSDITTPKFAAHGSTYPGIKNTLNIGGSLGFVDTEGYKVLATDTFEVKEKFPQTDLGVTSAYLDYVYSIKGTVLSRYSKNATALEATTWAQNADFENARAMAIAYSIYILKQDGGFASYTAGTKDTLVLSGEKATLNNPVQIIADIDFTHIYIADKGNKRVAVFNDKGEFVKELKAKKEDRWDNILSIGVSPDEKLLFVLNGSKVYKVSIEE